MHSKQHALVSAVIGLLFALRYRRPMLVPIALIVGVGIDFDHFVLAWYEHEDLRAARRAYNNPEYVFENQNRLFAGESAFSVDGGRPTTLSVHATETFGATVVADSICDEAVARTVFAAMGGHVACDTYQYLRN